MIILDPGNTLVDRDQVYIIISIFPARKLVERPMVMWIRSNLLGLSLQNFFFKGRIYSL